MTQPCVVIADIVSKPGYENLVEETFRAALPAVHAEPGCLLYALHRTSDDPLHFVMIEKWESLETLGAHSRGEALRQVTAALGDALAGPPAVRVLEALPGGEPGAGAL